MKIYLLTRGGKGPPPLCWPGWKPGLRFFGERPRKTSDLARVLGAQCAAAGVSPSATHSRYVPHILLYQSSASVTSAASQRRAKSRGVTHHTSMGYQARAMSRYGCALAPGATSTAKRPQRSVWLSPTGGFRNHWFGGWCKKRIQKLASSFALKYLSLNWAAFIVTRFSIWPTHRSFDVFRYRKLESQKAFSTRSWWGCQYLHPFVVFIFLRWWVIDFYGTSTNLFLANPGPGHLGWKDAARHNLPSAGWSFRLWVVSVEALTYWE